MSVANFCFSSDPERFRGRYTLSGRIGDGLAAWAISICHRNRFDLDSGAFWQCWDLDSRADRRRLLEIRAVNFVYRLEIGEIGQENRRFDNIFERKALGFEDRRDVIENAPGLLGDVF